MPVAFFLQHYFLAGTSLLGSVNDADESPPSELPQQKLAEQNVNRSTHSAN
jgi:hypothetical protein